jgi:photosystem II stability/assembly factor-like uncharacterized protein
MLKRTNMRRFYFILLALCLTNFASAQDWFLTNSFLWDMKFYNAQIGFAVGDLGSFRKTTDGGANWKFSQTGAETNLRSVHIANPDTVYAVGEEGVIVRTYDGGDHWQVTVMPKRNDLISVFFINTKIGFAVGGLGDVYQTMDYGTSWALVSSSITNDLYAVYFLNQSVGFTGGTNTGLLRTDDGGKTWNSVYPAGSVRSIFFTDANTGYVAGPGVLKTTDGGNTWTPLSSLLPNEYRFITFVDASTGYLILGNEILKTIDAGNSWTQQLTGVTVPLWCVAFSSAGKGFAAGKNGLIITTIDGGNTWNKTTEGTNYGLNASFALTEQIVVAVGASTVAEGVIMKTNDGGITWSKQFTDNSLASVFFTDLNNGYAVGHYGCIMKTTDGGNTWSKQNVENQGASPALYSVYFTNATTGYAVGTLGQIVKTNDAGATWTFLSSNTSFNLESIWFTDQNTGYIASGGSAILKTSDGGNTWQSTSIGNAMFSVHFPTPSTGFSVGAFGTVMKTVDAGTTWTKIPGVLTGYGMRSVWFIDEQTGYIATGDVIDFIIGGRILKTTDGGATWTNSTGKTPEPIGHVTFNRNTGYAVSSNGVIFKNKSGGGSIGINELTEKKPVILFPNPSDGLVTIRTINAATGSILSITDMKGRTILSKVIQRPDETIDLGSYPKGVYLFRIIDGKEVRCSKLVKE